MMEQRGFYSQVLAQALGTLVAAAVIYLVGVLGGAFTANVLGLLVSIGSVVVFFAFFAALSAAGEVIRARRHGHRPFDHD